MGERLATVVKLAGKWFGVLMDDFVRSSLAGKKSCGRCHNCKAFRLCVVVHGSISVSGRP